jgi:hypothetical protein
MAEEDSELLRRIDERTEFLVRSVDRHLQDDRNDFADLRKLIVDHHTTHAEDFAFVREIREMAKDGKFFEPLRAADSWKATQDTVKKAGLKAATVTIVGAVIGIFWLGFLDKIRELFH